jgi:hypothetical protein
MDEHDEVRALLTAVTPPPSRVELSVVLHDGERRAQRRRLVTAVAIVTAVVTTVVAGTLAGGALRGRPGDIAPEIAGVGSPSVAGSSAAAAGSCVATPLPAPPGKTRVQAVSVDPTGHYIGGYHVEGQNFVPILWTGNAPQLLQINATSAYLSAINEHGVGTGIASSGADEWVFRYENGKAVRLSTPAGYEHPYPEPDINAAGDIVINAEPAGEAGGASSIALLWKANTTTPIKLPLPRGAGVSGITDDGRVVGGVYDENSRARAAYVWDQAGRGTQLAVPAGMTTMAHATRGEWVVGGVFDPSASRTPGALIRWNLRTGAVATFTAGVGTAVNASGWLVSLDGSLTTDRGLVELANTGPYPQVVATAVADNGLVVGYTMDRTTGKSQPLTWRC